MLSWLFNPFKKIINSNFSILEPKAIPRGCDDFGCGHFGSSRGDRTHKGTDLKFKSGEYVRAYQDGYITRIGYPYKYDTHFKLIEQSFDGLLMLCMYVQPVVGVGQFVKRGQVIGVCQDIAGKYNTETETMINHIHVEVRKDGKAINPNPYL